MRSGFRAGGALAVLAVGAGMAFLAPGVGASNSPTFRDCAMAAGIDPDFVRLSKVNVSGSSLTVPMSQGHVSIEASESSLPGDMQNHATLHVSVKAKNAPATKLSGNGTGHVTLSVPLKHRKAGRSYTISWNATFDNGNHVCPSSATPQNQTAMPFVVKVS